MLKQAVAAEPVIGMPYFRYLPVRLGRGNVSLTKRSAWSILFIARKIAIMSGTRNGISAPGEVGQTDALMEAVEMNLQKAIEKIEQDEKNDFTKLQEAGIATDAQAAQNKIAVDNEISDMKHAVGKYV